MPRDPLSASLTALCSPPILQPHWSCFRAFRVFFTVPSSDRNLPSCPQILHLGPVSLLFTDMGILLLAFWSRMEGKDRKVKLSVFCGN